MCDSGNPFKCSCILGIYNDWNFPVFFWHLQWWKSSQMLMFSWHLQCWKPFRMLMFSWHLQCWKPSRMLMFSCHLQRWKALLNAHLFFVFQESCTFGKFLTTRNCHISWNKERLWNTTRNVVFLFHFIVISCTGNLPFFQVNLLKSNMDSGTNVYFSRVNKVIHLFKGADSSWHQKIRDCLSIFLKGTKKKKAKLMIDHPNEY